MSDASESVRRAWAAVSASVSGYLPTEMPTLPRLPALSLPKINLPQVPAISPPLGRFFSSLTTLMFAPGLRIAGGTDEILKNIIAERVLGLPGDIRVDKDVAFKDMPTGR